MQESDDVAHVLRGHRGLFAQFAVERRIGHVHIGAVLRQQVVVLAHLAVHGGVDSARLHVAEVVEIEHLLERVIDPVMEIHRPLRHIAQRGSEEHAAVGSLVFQVGPEGAAQPDIEVVRVLVRRNLWITRHAQRLVLRVGEQRRQMILGRLIQMAGSAIALVHIVERQIAAHFLRRQSRPALQPGVVLAVEGVELRVFDLVTGDRKQRLGNRLLRVCKHIGAEELQKHLGIRLALDDGGHALRRARVHFHRVEQRATRLLLQGIDPPVPEQPAGGHQILYRLRRALRGLLRPLAGLPQRRELLQGDGFVLLVVRADGERLLPVEVGQRRRRAKAGCSHIRPAQHHRPTARRRVVAIGRIMTRRARLLARG